jgi:CTP synthase (UTP-ammonia lyase)
MLTVLVVMDLPAGQAYHAATLAALGHAASDAGLEADIRVVPTDQIDDDVFSRLGLPGTAVVIGPGSPYRDPDTAHEVIRLARERGVPLVGTWGGFQHVLVEHARNLLGIADASHAEYDVSGTPVVTLLACSLQQMEITVDLASGSRLAQLHGVSQVVERTTCSYGLAVGFQHIAATEGMSVAGTDDTGEVRAVERPDHPFFVATLYQPQLRSAPGSPHPVFAGLLAAAASST